MLSVAGLQWATTFANDVELDGEGRPVGHRLASSVIKSAKRLTYLEAQALIDGDRRAAAKHARTEPKYDAPLCEKLELAADTIPMLDSLVLRGPKSLPLYLQ